jgi:hypothetical protein
MDGMLAIIMSASKDFQINVKFPQDSQHNPQNLGAGALVPNPAHVKQNVPRDPILIDPVALDR